MAVRKPIRSSNGLRRNVLLLVVLSPIIIRLRVPISISNPDGAERRFGKISTLSGSVVMIFHVTQQGWTLPRKSPVGGIIAEVLSGAVMISNTHNVLLSSSGPDSSMKLYMLRTAHTAQFLFVGNDTEV